MLFEVAPRLHWGDRAGAIDARELRRRAVTHILTVDSQPLPPAPVGDDGDVDDGDAGVAAGQPVLLFCPAEDSPSWDLLPQLESCLAFIDAGMQAGTVLVHCHSGVSRSAAVVAAFLMRRREIPSGSALAILTEINPAVSINPGFWDQLGVFEADGCSLSTNGPAYRHYRLRRAVQSGEPPSLSVEMFASDPQQQQSPAAVPGTIYKCRKCRRALFRGDSVLPHAPPHSTAQFSHRRHPPTLGSISGPSSPCCTSLFVEPIRWMETGLLGAMDGPLLCPKCVSKLGSFSWPGQRCSCGAWVTPAIQIHRTRVDESGTRTRPPVLVVEEKRI